MMDLIGPLPETAHGNKYIVTVTDYFTKWAEDASLPSKHATGVVKVLFSRAGYSNMAATSNIASTVSLALLTLYIPLPLSSHWGGRGSGSSSITDLCYMTLSILLCHLYLVG